MNSDYSIIKYPRTPHLEGSRLQPGDEDLSQIPFKTIQGRHIVIEEKVDGANTAISFDPAGNLLLQSRGSYLTGGGRERHYDLFKKWANEHRWELYPVLGCRYVLYGEWLYAKHTVYYDALPAYFMEFDILDRETDRFLDTPTRHAMLEGLPICSVPVLAEGCFRTKEEVLKYLVQSNYITDRHMENLREECIAMGLDADRNCRETDPGPLMEGLYIKVEEDSRVVDRMKYVRAGFSQMIEASGSHWLQRPIIPNLLKDGHE